MNEPPSAFTAPNLPRVWAAPAPLYTAPRITKMLQSAAAVPKRIICVPTAVPKTLEASFAPNDQPRKRPLVRKRSTAISMTRHLPYILRLIV
jgi:hypothetical protein